MITRVTNNIFRGPRLGLDDYKMLKNYGITHILNLENDEAAIRSDKLLAAQMGMHIQVVRMSEFRRPKKETLQFCVSILQDKENYPIYVHCKHGADRTGYVIGAYRRIVQGWTFDAAYKEAKDMGHHWWFAPYLLLWPKSLKEL